jgi:hypothetical protein
MRYVARICEVIVIRHQAPREDRQAVQVPNSTEDIDKFDGLFIGVEDILAAGDAAVDMVGRTGNKQAGMSRHRISPMRGRDTQILPNRNHNAPMR